MGNKQTSVECDPRIENIQSVATASKRRISISRSIEKGTLSHHYSHGRYLDPVGPSPMLQLSTPTNETNATPTNPTPVSLPGITPTPVTPITYHGGASFPSTLPVKHLQQARNSSNGIAGILISRQIIAIAAQFWQCNLQNLTKETQLEIACSILFGTISRDKKAKRILVNNSKRKHKSIKYMSLKYLDMIGWLMRHIIRDDIDLYQILADVGVFHQNIGVKTQHFKLMLDAMHDTFSYYFPTEYNLGIKYAMDEIITVCAQIMSGQDLKRSPDLDHITNSFTEQDVALLNNLDICLQSCVGRRYLFAFLRQTFCDEIVLFLQSIEEFKRKVNVTEKFMVARQIINASVLPDAALTLRISFECRDKTLQAMRILERQFIDKKALNIDNHFFDRIEKEIYKLVENNHWQRFVADMKDVYGQISHANTVYLSYV